MNLNKIKCPKCKKGDINYKVLVDFNLAMCPNCHYYIHKKEINNE